MNSTDECPYCKPLRKSDAALESLSANTKTGEGWIEWKGGECPVDPEANVRLRYANTMEVEHPAKAVYWRNQKKGHQPWGPITHYRLIDKLRRPWEPKGNPQQCVGTALVTPSARSGGTDGPRNAYWRDGTVTWGELVDALRTYESPVKTAAGTFVPRTVNANALADHLAKRREG